MVSMDLGLLLRDMRRWRGSEAGQKADAAGGGVRRPGL